MDTKNLMSKLTEIEESPLEITLAEALGNLETFGDVYQVSFTDGSEGFVAIQSGYTPGTPDTWEQPGDYEDAEFEVLAQIVVPYDSGIDIEDLPDDTIVSFYDYNKNNISDSSKQDIESDLFNQGRNKKDDYTDLTDI